MRPYELVVLLHPDLEIDAERPILAVEKLIEQSGGKVSRRDNWGKKRLAYQLGSHSFAVYVYFELQLDPSKVVSLERGLRLSEEVIRHLLVSYVDRPTPSPRRLADKKPTEQKAAPVTDEVATKKTPTKAAVVGKES